LIKPILKMHAFIPTTIYDNDIDEEAYTFYHKYTSCRIRNKKQNSTKRKKQISVRLTEKNRSHC